MGELPEAALYSILGCEERVPPECRRDAAESVQVALDKSSNTWYSFLT